MADSFASLTEARITTRLGEIKRRVIGLGEGLENEVNGRSATFLNGLIDDLAAHTCRIAVIGQIKAGKSSLINALMRRPDLLPTDINPSTAVITKLHFGAAPEKANTALFHFFSDEEWDRIMSGGRAGAMSMQRHSAFRPEQLETPLEELRRRAEKRLGPKYPSLLGKHHLLSAVTSSTLERYVSAGDYADTPHSAEEGREERFYSDITRTADIFLEGQPLGYPSVIIDTPGVNDPFLVRDEITHGDLGEADIYLVVLTAQQPLSRSDLALLRILKGLQKDRIIAVVNRVDIVDGIATKGEKLIGHVRASLRREFPHTEIPVILASAHWGNAALSADEAEMADVLTPALADYAEAQALHGENNFGRPGAGWPAERVAQLLYQLSGIPAIVAAISKLIGHSVTAERLLPAASTIGAVADNTAISVRYGLKTLQGARPTSARNADEWFRANALDHLKRLEHLLSHVEMALQATTAEFTALAHSELDRLRKFMHCSVDSFAEKERENLLKLGIYAAFRAEFQDASFVLRSQLAEDFYTYFTQTAKQLLLKQQEAEAALRQTVKDALPDLDDVLRFGFQAADVPAPSIIPLSKVTALDMDAFWQARGSRPVTAADADEFKALINDAFVELIDGLFRAADESLKDHVSEALRRLRYLSYSAIYPIAQQLQQWVEAHKGLTGAEPADAEARASALREEILAEGHAHLLRCEKLAVDAADVKRQCIYMKEG